MVWICTTTERPDDDVSTIKERPGVFRCHAAIRSIRPEQILNYQAVFGDENAPSKEVIVRMPPDVKVDLNHWVYRECGAYSKMWMKVRSVEDIDELGKFLLMRCSIDTVLDERSDPATQPLPPTWETPDRD